VKWGSYVDLKLEGKTHPFPDWFIADIVKLLAADEKVDTSIAPGQPFRLMLMKRMLQKANDPDYKFMDELAKGLRLGVEDPIPLSPGIWPTVEEMRGDFDPEEDDFKDYELSAKDNYSSADDHLKELEKTYWEEKEMGMVLGPYTLEEAAKACGCKQEEVITGAMGANVEKDKIRPIYDATTSNVNPRIQKHTLERTTAPGLADGAHCIRWSHRNLGWQYKKLGVLKQFVIDKNARKGKVEQRKTT